MFAIKTFISFMHPSYETNEEDSFLIDDEGVMHHMNEWIQFC